MATTRRAGPGDLTAIVGLYAQLHPDDPPLDPADARSTYAVIENVVVDEALR